MVSSGLRGKLSDMGGSKLSRQLEESLHGKAHDAVVDIVFQQIA
jgi:hypothetical protein